MWAESLNRVLVLSISEKFFFTISLLTKFFLDQRGDLASVHCGWSLRAHLLRESFCAKKFYLAWNSVTLWFILFSDHMFQFIPSERIVIYRNVRTTKDEFAGQFSKEWHRMPIATMKFHCKLDWVSIKIPLQLIGTCAIKILADTAFRRCVTGKEVN